LLLFQFNPEDLKDSYLKLPSQSKAQTDLKTPRVIVALCGKLRKYGLDE